MIASLGRTLILLSLLVSAAGCVAAFAAARLRSVEGAVWARRFAYAFAALMGLANAVMIYALLVHDFSVSYVAQVGSRSVPTWVTIVSLWSSLEGSILFWGLILGIYVALATWSIRRDDAERSAYTIGVWLACSTFFSFLIAGPASPFGTVPNPPLDGPGPNPLLQNHILMTVHPPFLYLGYVGMTIPFGLATAALLTGRFGHDALRLIRLWTIIPWAFLTVAIMLGGWWAYEVLGWGGYWAWDPVENASLLPWLTATAAIHSAIVLERRGVLKGWTITLIQATFLLTILGTFMTRSGVFNSVHSFTQSAIGPTILVFLAALLVACVAVLALRIDRLTAEGTIEQGLTRESTFLINNLLFVLFTFTVLIGTVFPLIVEAVDGRQMSVGRPYFDRMVVPIGAALLFLMGVGPALPWGRASREEIRRALIPPAVSGTFLLTIGLVLGVRNPWTVLTLFFAGYTLHVTLKQMWKPAAVRMRAGRESIGSAIIEGQFRRGRRQFGAYLSHAAVVLTMCAIAVSSTMKTSTEVQMSKGQSVNVGGYTITFTGLQQIREPHRDSIIANVDLSRNGRAIATLRPRMNQYETMREPIGTPDVLSTWKEDVYLSVVNIGADGQSVGLNASVHPMIVWVWIAVIVMAIGGLVALIPARRAVAVVRPVTAGVEAEGASGA